MNKNADLTKSYPRSAIIRIEGYAILARTLDKCRASIAGKIGEYHFDCPVDKQLFGFKNITGDQFKEEVKKGKSDLEIAKWLSSVGDKKSEKEIKEWSDKVCLNYPDKNPATKEWFIGECKGLNLNPETTTLFQYLDVDDKVSFAK